ncbi:MAG: hypothetical protein EOO68_04820, partial [Moraxellaceae bacterium]
LYGFDGADELTGTSNPDEQVFMIGGKSYDRLTYGSRFYFNEGDGGNGGDIIEKAKGEGRIVFGATITQESLRIRTTLPNSIAIEYGNMGDLIDVRDFYNEESQKQTINFIEFNDGTVLDAAAIRTLLMADTTSSGKVFSATPFDDRASIKKGSGYFYIKNGGKDYFTGGVDEDSFKADCDDYDCSTFKTFYREGDITTVAGGAGNDSFDLRSAAEVVFEVAPGDGRDNIYRLPSRSLDIYFKAGVTQLKMQF